MDNKVQSIMKKIDVITIGGATRDVFFKTDKDWVLKTKDPKKGRLLCLEYGAKLIFISSECVFDGEKEFYNENDAVCPLSVYGKQKAQSEKWIQGNLDDYVIIRSMSVYGWDPLTKTPNALMKL